jgi:FAD/FMN-containing dehydrogenase
VQFGEPGYEEARAGAVWNGRKPARFPQLIVQPETADEVSAAVRHARREGLRIGIRSGGHSWAASFLRDGGMLIDLSRMHDLAVDPVGKTAWVGPGLSGDELNRQLELHNLFFPTGHCTSVGLGGFLLQGGFGWNSRLWGPACVSVQAIEVVTADGALTVADANRNPDLFWAARGAGPGFFGVVTGFQLILYPRPRAALITTHIYPIEALGELVSWVIAVQPEIPPSVECMIFLRRDLPGLNGPGILLMAPALAESDDEAHRALAFTESCPCVRQAVEREEARRTSVAEMLVASQAMYPDGKRFWVDNMWTNSSAEELIPALTEIAQTLPPPPSHAMMLMWGPPLSLPDMAFSMQANVYLGLYGVGQQPADDGCCREWSFGHMRRCESLSCGIQLADENLGLRAATFASDANMTKLRALRQRFDPEEVFHGYMGARP